MRSLCIFSPLFQRNCSLTRGGHPRIFILTLFFQWRRNEPPRPISRNARVAIIIRGSALSSRLYIRWLYHSVCAIWWLCHSVAVPFGGCAIRRLYHSAAVPFGGCTIRRLYHLVAVLFGGCTIRWLYHSWPYHYIIQYYMSISLCHYAIAFGGYIMHYVIRD